MLEIEILICFFFFNLQEELEDRPRISTLISSLANYSNTIPAASEADAKPGQKSARMGTLIGVFLPCIQNIFGVILFIRLTWVVGTAGAVCGFLIVLICCCVVCTFFFKKNKTCGYLLIIISVYIFKKKPLQGLFTVLTCNNVA